MTKACVFLLSLLLLVSAGSTPKEQQTANTVKIGAFLLLTGATPAYGISAANAIKLATEEANRNGAICSRPDSIRRLGSYFANHFWAGSDDPLVKKFVADYRAKYGVDPDAGCRYCIRRGANAL